MNGLKFLVNAGSPDPTITRHECALAFAASGAAVCDVESDLAAASATTTSAASNGQCTDAEHGDAATAGSAGVT